MTSKYVRWPTRCDRHESNFVQYAIQRLVYECRISSSLCSDEVVLERNKAVHTTHMNKTATWSRAESDGKMILDPLDSSLIAISNKSCV